MRRSLPAASIVALVATLLTATPAAADDLSRAAVPVLRAPAEVDPAEAVVAPVSDDAHPVTPEVELVGFGAEPADGTPEAEALAESDAVETESPEAGSTEGDSTETETETQAETEPEPTDPTESDATEPAEVESGMVDGAQSSAGAASLSAASSVMAASVTDEPTEGLTSQDETVDPPSNEVPTDEAPTGEPTDEPTDEPTADEPSASPATDDATDAPSAGDHEHDHEEGHDHGEEGHDHDASGEELATQLYASSETPELSVLGVTWDLGTAPDDLVVEMRTRTAEEWTDWEPLHVEATETRDDETEIAEARDGTMPTALIAVDAVEVRLASDTALPTAPNLAVVDPGESTADSAQVTAATTMAAAATSRPTIYSRAQWGADERMMTWTPSQGRVQGIDIHHTVNANDYTQAQVPALMRSIYAYHAQDWGRGWGDIGYNFIVDRFGRIWEGRAGGVDQAPTGAHATGLNSNFSGISLLGNFDTAAVPSAAFNAVGRLAAWKLAMHGITTSGGTVTVDAGTFARINGHRDSKQTTCPGRYMYSRLGEMRTLINNYLGSFGDRQLDRDLDGDGFADLVVTQGSRVSLASTVDRGTWTVKTTGSGWSSWRTVSPGDFDGNGTSDLMLVGSDGRLWFYPGTSSGTFGARQQVGVGWQIFTFVLGAADWDSDGNPDLIAKRPDGSLWLYRGNGRGGFKGSIKIGVGWNAMSGLSVSDDFVNGRPALLTQDKAGNLYAYPADGAGRFTSRVLTSRTWSSTQQTVGVPDATGDKVGDLVSVDAAGRLWLYPGNGRGGLETLKRVPFGTGWGSMRVLALGGRGGEDLALAAVRGDARLLRYGYTHTRTAYVSLADTGLRVGAGARVVAPGDWTGDGRADLMVITSGGALLLHRGTGAGKFAVTGSQIGVGWGGMVTVVGAGNWRGDGRPGLVAHERSSGRLLLYPGNGAGGFLPRVVVSTGATGMNYLVNAGRWDSGGAPDLFMRGADSGKLFFYNGNGPGLALPPVALGPGWATMRGVVGVNDVTGDGAADMVAVTAAGAVLIYPGNRYGGFLTPIPGGTLPTSVIVS
ncbi:FG-GAP-like repeat-containing protein [Pseudactinotalea suaedae]|uniref:FG-GAP-like repeat-containing protein n=1 Tax=Pseudactinotalea suaedae TaxID=1524924 RepID=UPI0012E14EA1|nr:FG-GAP-like repeat-containing protein [Pseudactinotalea suaedae]